MGWDIKTPSSAAVIMDPMEQAEAEMLRKEEENRRDLESAIGLENFMDRRDFSDRGSYTLFRNRAGFLTDTF